MRQYRAQKFDVREKGQCSKILVIDHASMTSYAISKLLDKHPALSIVGHETDSAAAFNLCRQLLPDIVIIDPAVSGLDAPSVIKNIKRINPGVKIMIYTHESKAFSLKDCVELKVNSVILKNSPLKTLVFAIQSLSAGKDFLDNALTPAASNNDSNTPLVSNPVEVPTLSPRERQILKLIVEGGKNKEIASTLSLSVKTIESHRLNLMRKLNAHSVLDLIRWAQRMNISHCVY